MDVKTAQVLVKAQEALFAMAGPRRPIEEMQGICHSGITTADKCVKCSMYIKAWESIQEIDESLPISLKRRNRELRKA